MSFLHKFPLIVLLSLLIPNPYVECSMVESTHHHHNTVTRHSKLRHVQRYSSTTSKKLVNKKLMQQHPVNPPKTRPVQHSSSVRANSPPAKAKPAAKKSTAKPKPVVAPANHPVAKTPAACTPFTEHFTAPIGSSGSQWTSLSSLRDSVQMSPGGGVELLLHPPAGTVTVSKDGHTNDKLGDGATINSTFSLFYGKVSFTLEASSVPGTVTAAVLIGTKTDDEIDIEILGGDPTHWQTNVFHSAPGETEPLYGIFGGVEGYTGNGRVDGLHTYVVDWSPTRIQWSVDGQVMRTLTPAQTLHNGQQHYPSRASRIQIGIWDASNPVGTSDWAKGPVPWSKIKPKNPSALIKSVVVECPYN